MMRTGMVVRRRRRWLGWSICANMRVVAAIPTCSGSCSITVKGGCRADASGNSPKEVLGGCSRAAVIVWDDGVDAGDAHFGRHLLAAGTYSRPAPTRGRRCQLPRHRQLSTHDRRFGERGPQRTGLTGQGEVGEVDSELQGRLRLWSGYWAGALCPRASAARVTFLLYDSRFSGSHARFNATMRSHLAAEPYAPRSQSVPRSLVRLT